MTCTLRPASGGSLLIVLASLLVFTAKPAGAAGSPPEISAASLAARTKVLSSDDFEGRAPATPGEDTESCKSSLRPSL